MENTILMNLKNRFVKLSLIVILFFSLHSCWKEKKNQASNPEISYSSVSYSLEDLTEVDLDVFEMWPAITPIMDSIIDLANICKNYKNIQLGFVIESYKDSSDIHKFHFSTLSEPDKLNYTYCKGISFYKGYQIVLIGDVLLDHFANLGVKETIFFVSPEKKEYIDQKYGEFFDSAWDYLYEEGEFICYHYNYCGSFWYDESFYPGED